MTDLIVKQPLPTLNKSIKFNLKDLFINLGKVAIAAKAGKPTKALFSAMDALKSLQLENKPEWVAWVLISKALDKTLMDLVTDYRDLFQTKLTDEQIEKLAQSTEASLNELTVTINANFFKQPQKLALLDQMKRSLVAWLKEFDWDNAQAEAFHLRMKNSFVFALHAVWASEPEAFQQLEATLRTPFSNASLEQKNWLKYNASLATLSNERVFNEAFSLSQVYVPLNAYYEEKDTLNDCDTIDDSAAINNRINNNNENSTKIVFDLHDYIHQWVKNFDKDNALKVIRGGPGCGKSSFSRMLVAEVAERGDVPVLFIPLHRFDPSKDLTQAVDDFIATEGMGVTSPLDATNGQERLLIVFDGLDELSMKSQADSQVAESFVQEVHNVLHRFNSGGTLKRQAIITGRDIAVQGSEQRLRKPQQILHMLPYYLDEEEQAEYKDKEEKLKQDLRNVWWKKFAIAKGLTYKSIPKELSSKSLTPITREPLLNYLVALSYQRKKVDFNNSTTLNTIYKDLLEAVYERQWGDDDQHTAANMLKKEEFFRILEEIALAVWHGHGRTASQSAIYQRCEDSSLTQYLDKFSAGAEKGVVRLLTAFYFREAGKESSGDSVFEFTHKSFGEYLTARRIVREVENIHKKVKRHKKDPDDGISLRGALEQWAKISGQTMVDDYLFGFLKDEIAARKKNTVKKWQKTFAKMLGSAVNDNMPMEKLNLANFKEMLRQSCNAESSLLVIYNACFLRTQSVIDIDWENRGSFQAWWKRVSGQLDDNYFIGRRFSGLHLSNCYLSLSDFLFVNFIQSCLRGASFQHSILSHADLKGADLKGADLTGADLTGANLRNANLEDANLEGAINLENADFTNAKLKGTCLEKD